MPRAVFWYRIYCCLFAVFNLGMFAVCLWFVSQHDELANEVATSPVILVTGLVGAPFSLFLAAGDIWLVRAKHLKKPWELHMSNIMVGILTCFLAPFALPLLFAWFRPEVRAYYDGRTSVES